MDMRRSGTDGKYVIDKAHTIVLRKFPPSHSRHKRSDLGGKQLKGAEGKEDDNLCSWHKRGNLREEQLRGVEEKWTQKGCTVKHGLQRSN